LKNRGKTEEIIQSKWRCFACVFWRYFTCASPPRKQRHTGTRIWERLRDEYGFRGSVSAVRRYLQQRQQTQGEVFFPLQFEAGEEGQVDWGEAWCWINGEEQKVFLFCLRLCYSHVSYVRAYYQESLECFLDGHVHAFAWPTTISRAR
jgi:transposase